MKATLFFLISLLMCFRVAAQELPCCTDSTRSYDHRFRYQHILAPAALVTVGAIGIVWDKPRKEIRKAAEKMGGNHNTYAAEYLQYSLIPVNLFLGSTGVKSKHNLVDRIMITATAYMAEAALVNSMKYSIREARPHGQKNSFPSGHTATAFVGAELVREEYGNAIGSVAYLTAASVGFLRVYTSRHWVNDVLGGAGIGILSARVGYWMYPLEKRWFTPKKKKHDTSVVVMPTYSPEDNTAGIGMVAQF